MFITINNIHYRYSSSASEALSGLSATFAKGWTGIVGDNGAGKSTLLQILCEGLKPDQGNVSSKIVGEYCRQSTESCPYNLEDLALDYSGQAMKLKGSLKLQDEWFWRYESLSHGERKRLQLACALYLEPKILALDEPTNHLDSEAKEIILNTLVNFNGIGLLVSHDRHFLDELVYQCLFMSKGTGDLIPGSYSQGLMQRSIQYKAKVTERKNAKDSLSRLQAESQRRKVLADKTSSRRSGKNLAKHDSDGREKLRLAIYSGQDGKRGALSSQMDKKAENAQSRLDSLHVEKRYTKGLDQYAIPSKRKVIFRKCAGAIQLAENCKLIFPDLFIGNLDRIGLEGSNGSGKSSLMKAIAQELLPDSGIVYIPQEMTSDEGRSLLEEVKELPSNERGHLLSLVARLNSPPDRILSGQDLSPGELRKLMLAISLLKSPYLIMMDEPTNHLDIGSIEALQAVLSECNCALVLISHDKLFLDELVSIRWQFKQRKNNESANDLCISIKNQ